MKNNFLSPKIDGKDEKGGLFSFLGFGGKKVKLLHWKKILINPKQVPVDDLDNKLDNLQLSSKFNQDGQPQDLTASTFFKNNFGPVSRDNPFYIERNSNNQYERTYLPQVNKRF